MRVAPAASPRASIDVASAPARRYSALARTLGRMTRLGLIVAIIVAPALAAADPPNYDDEIVEDLEERPSGGFGAIGLASESREVGPYDASLDGFVAAAGFRQPHHALYVEATVGHQDGRGDDPVSGVAGGLAGHLRRDVAAMLMGDEKNAGYIGCWIDLGVGAQAMRLGDQTIVRPELSFGVGGGADYFERRKSIGSGVELRLTITPSTRFDVGAGRCRDGCAMDLSRFDVSAGMVLSFPFAR